MQIRPVEPYIPWLRFFERGNFKKKKISLSLILP